MWNRDEVFHAVRPHVLCRADAVANNRPYYTGCDNLLYVPTMFAFVEGGRSIDESSGGQIL